MPPTKAPISQPLLAPSIGGDTKVLDTKVEESPSTRHKMQQKTQDDPRTEVQSSGDNI